MPRSAIPSSLCQWIGAIVSLLALHLLCHHVYLRSDRSSLVSLHSILLRFSAKQSYLSSLSGGLDILFLARQLPCLHALLEQHNIGERPDATRDRRDRPGDFT